MNTCKDCIFWKEWQHEDGSPKSGLGDCISPKFIEGKPIKSDTLDEIYAVDYYAPYFVVSKNFGCIHFEPKEA